MFKKVVLSSLMSVFLVVGGLQVLASVGGDCSTRQLNCCPGSGEFGGQLIHCQNMWNGDVFCAYDDDSVIDVTSCAGGTGGGSGGGETGEDSGE